MNKKLLLIPLGIVVLLLIIKEIVSPAPMYGSEFNANVPVMEEEQDVSLKSVNLYMDCSGSMKGFIDFSGLKGESSMSKTISGFLDNVDYEYREVEIKCYINVAPLSRTDFRKKLDNVKKFNSLETKLHEIIEEKVKEINDTSVIAFVSDMVLSYGRKELRSKNNIELNYERLGDLSSGIHSAMKDLKKKDYDVLLLQYFSDFNGSYYCDYTENLKKGNKYDKQLMKNRPYYILLIGKKNNLKSLLSKGCLTKPENIYSSFGLENKFMTTVFDIKEKDDNWTKGDEKGIGSFWTSADLGDYKTSFKIICDSFFLPEYLTAKPDLSLEGKGNEYVSNVKSIKYDSKEKTLRFDVDLKSFDELDSESEVVIDFYCSNSWVDSHNIKNDVNVELKKLEGKTWMIKEIVNTIDKAFRGSEAYLKEKIATFNFMLNIEN